MKKELSFILLLVVLAGCNKSSDDKHPSEPIKNPKPNDLYFKGQVDAFETLETLTDAIDIETGFIKKDLSYDPKYEELIRKLRGKKFCSCELLEQFDIHETGQAHVHQDKLIVNADSPNRPLMGFLTLYQKPDIGSNPKLPCTIYFINSKLKTLSDCQHISKANGDPAFKFLCFNRLPVAYKLEPEDSTGHDHNSPCH